MIKFTDIIYGKIELPDWIEPFLTIPEFVRLRGVRLSNIDSIDLKDFNTPTRWEHSIGAAFLAVKYAEIKKLKHVDKIHLIIASLLHDIGTPPYAHTVEYILSNFDHEKQAFDLIIDNDDEFSFEGNSGGFTEKLKQLKKNKKIKLDPLKIAEIIIGEGKYGFLLNGSIDIDNIDNLIRASFYSGINIDKKVPLKLIQWLSNFESAPIDLDSQKEESVKKWIKYRNKLYKKFYESKNDLGRQAFLQHIIRRAYNGGMPRKPIIFSTDERILYTIEQFDEKEFLFEGKKYQNRLSSLVNSFRLMKKITLITSIKINDEENLRIFSNPSFANWLELKLFNNSFEPFVLVNRKRFKSTQQLNSIKGEINIYLLVPSSINYTTLPKWMKDKIPRKTSQVNLKNSIKQVLNKSIKKWLIDKPWQSLNTFRIDDIRSNLKHERDWSFKNDKNKSIHVYPATFVKTIPSKIISSLNIKGELIIDPFGGTGQTAEESIRLGCRVISSDINQIAFLIAKTKLTYLPISLRNDLKKIKINNFIEIEHYKIPEFNNVHKWHHKDTLIELSKILTYINSEENILKQNFLKVCFSDILMSSTERKGKSHSYFADNTPIPKTGKSLPSYKEVYQAFLKKIYKNIKIIESFYSYLERKQRDPKIELDKATILKVDARKISPELYNIKKKSASAIITSPPYLCMIDYTLGQRLSYEWLFPEHFINDFKKEIAPRRKRNKKQEIYNNYIDDISLFITNSKSLLRKNGYLILVIAEPKAKSFCNYQIIKTIDNFTLLNGFDKVWEINRPINWHRNHGISHLNTEKILIYILKE